MARTKERNNEDSSFRKASEGRLQAREEYKNHNRFLAGRMTERFYDKDEDILDLQFSEKKYWKSVEAGDIIIDLAEDGTIIGLEIHQASKIFKKDLDSIKTA
jgi:uncharacterized protein YuzE